MKHVIEGNKVLGVLGVFAVCLTLTGGTATHVWAATAKEIDANVDVTLERLYGEVKDGKKLAQEAKGVLVFPKVYKAGFGIGGE